MDSQGSSLQRITSSDTISKIGTPFLFPGLEEGGLFVRVYNYYCKVFFRWSELSKVCSSLHWHHGHGSFSICFVSFNQKDACKFSGKLLLLFILCASSRMNRQKNQNLTLGDYLSSRGSSKNDKNNDTKKDSNRSVSLISSLTPAQNVSSNGQPSTSLRRVKIRSHHRHSSIPFPTRRISTAPSALRDGTKGLGRKAFSSLPGIEGSIVSRSRVPSGRRLTGNEPCGPKSSIRTQTGPSNGDERKERASLPFQRGAFSRFYGKMANEDEEKVPRKLDNEQRKTGKRAGNRISLPNSFIPIIPHTGGASIDEKGLGTRRMSPFKHDSFPPLRQRRYAPFSASESFSHLNGSGSGYEHLSLSPETRRNSSSRIFGSAHVSHLQDQGNDNPIISKACPVESMVYDPMQLKPLATPEPKPVPTSRFQCLRTEASPGLAVDPRTDTCYPTLGPMSRTLRIRREASSPNTNLLECPKMSREVLVNGSKANDIEEQGHSILLENPLRTPEKRVQVGSKSNSSPSKSKRSPGKIQKDRAERMVRLAPINYATRMRYLEESFPLVIANFNLMNLGPQVFEKQPLQYWLGRLVTLSNAFHHEDSFDEPDPATGFGSKSVLARSQLLRRADLSGYRIKRAFMVLERVCATDEARRSYKEFWNEYRSQYGHRWVF